MSAKIYRPIYTPPAPKPTRSDIAADWIRYSFQGAVAAVAVTVLFYGPRVVGVIMRWVL